MSTHAVIVVALSLFAYAAASPNETVAYIPNSDRAVIAEHAAIYSLVLTEYVKHRKSNEVLLLADRAVSFEQISDEKIESIQRREDLKGIAFKQATHNFRLKQLDKSLISNLNIRLVKSITNRQSRPQSLPGILSLSEILFDKEHLYASVAYEFYKGPRSAHGSTIVLKKVEGHWKEYGLSDVWVS